MSVSDGQPTTQPGGGRNSRTAGGGPAVPPEGAVDPPPRRPRDLTPRSLRFRPRRAVRWYDPAVLLGSLARSAITAAFGSFLDKRELQAQAGGEGAHAVPPAADGTDDDLWFDYVADTGDGFAGTYTVAWTVAQPAIEATTPDDGTVTLPRGRLLVLGGDECYPAATATAYEDRMEGPYRAALPWTQPPHPVLVALPGNHDWFDGLTGFLRAFGQGGWIGGWATVQRRSYFAVRLPGRWWLWGVDMRNDTYLDAPQLAYFRRVAEEEMEPGDRLVVAVPQPSWVEAEGDPAAYRNLGYIERTILRPCGIDLRLLLAGDQHHYARYTGTPAGSDAPRHLVTAGGGGAFLHPTHTLPPTLDVVADPDTEAVPDRFALTGPTYPDRRRSRLLALAAVGLPLRNPTFLVAPAAVYSSLLWTARFGLRALAPGDDRGTAASLDRSGWRRLATGLARNPTAGLGVGGLVVALGLATEAPPQARRPASRLAWKFGLGTAHTAAHVAAALGVGMATVAGLRRTRLHGTRGFVPAVAAAEALAGGVVGSLLMGGFLAATNAVPGLRANANLTFAAARLDRHRNLLRMHLTPDGALEVHVLGIDRAVPRRHWVPDPDAGDPSASWLRPRDQARTPVVRLVDRFIVT